MSVKEFCNREVVITHCETSIIEAAKLMRQYHVGDIVVIDSETELPVPVGILTDRDIVIELIAREVPFDAVTVGDVMSRELMVARECDSIWATLQRMRARGVRRVPVVNDRGGLEGILTVDDVLELLADELTLLAKVSAREQRVEHETRE